MAHSRTSSAAARRPFAPKRYTWRHDSALATLHPMLTARVDAQNALTPKRNAPRPIKFVKEGEGKARAQRGHTVLPHHHLLAGANDWQLLVDYDHAQVVFPPVICSTAERPDVVLWSCTTKVVILAELTVPAEENIEAAQDRKQHRYLPLKRQCAHPDHGWTCHLLTFEVGHRGVPALTLVALFRALGVPKSVAGRASQAVSTTVQRCSYAIFLAHKSAEWPHRDLVVQKFAHEGSN